MTARTVVVTDSTASLPPEVARARGIRVVPLQVVIGSQVHDEGEPGATPQAVAEALKSFVPVSTSRPNPAAMLEVYEALAREGVESVVAVHLSGDMSGTFESAQLAARQASIPVTPVDARQVGAATGYAAIAAQDVLDAGGDADQAAAAARERAAASKSYFYVDTLEYLRRGGRIGAGAAFLGGALSVKPLLEIRDGRVASLEKVRTSAKALARLEELLVRSAGSAQIDLCISHLASPERAEALASHLAERLQENLSGREVSCLEVGGVLGAHVGPGMVSGSLSVRF